MIDPGRGLTAPSPIPLRGFMDGYYVIIAALGALWLGFSKV